MKVKGCIAVVTGGASGLGLGIAKGLYNNGAKVIVFDINQKKLNDLDNNIISYNVDITNYDLVQKTVNNIINKYGQIDILINNAGVIYNEPLINIMNPADMKHSYNNFKKNLEINLNSVFIMSSIVVEKMVIKRIKGVIINISSISSNGNAGQTAYSSAKAGVEAMTKTWAKELGSFGIRTVAIAPGFINTESTRNALNDSFINHIKQNTPLKRLGEVKNISQSVLSIIENDFLNGAIIEVNGGLTL